MALPTSPVPPVAFDEIIEVTWGNIVAQSINNLGEMFDRVEWIPDTLINAPISTSTWTHWFTIGGDSNEVTVPDWSVGHGVTCHVFINGIRDTGAGNDAYELRLLFGEEEGRSVRLSAPVAVGADKWFGMAWMDHFPVPSPDPRAIKVEARRLAGADKWAIDGDADVCISFMFNGAIVA